MRLQNMSAVVTGGASGIGAEITKALVTEGANVLVVGRDREKLDALSRAHPHISTFAADLSNRLERQHLLDKLLGGPGPVDIFVNNAGTMRPIDLRDEDAFNQFENELALNLHAPIHLSLGILPHLLHRPEAALVNITTGLVYAPFAGAPAYAAAKAAVHAFDRALRWQVRDTNVQVLEVYPPTVDTALTENFDGPKMPPSAVAAGIIKALKKGRSELNLGQSKALAVMARIAPYGTFKMINRAIEKSMRKTFM